MVEGSCVQKDEALLDLVECGQNNMESRLNINVSKSGWIKLTLERWPYLDTHGKVGVWVGVATRDLLHHRGQSAIIIIVTCHFNGLDKNAPFNWSVSSNDKSPLPLGSVRWKLNRKDFSLRSILRNKTRDRPPAHFLDPIKALSD